jgi:hypothetical protein
MTWSLVEAVLPLTPWLNVGRLHPGAGSLVPRGLAAESRTAVTVSVEQLWEQFREGFRERLSHYCNRSCERRIRLAWRWPAARTQHYGGCILPRVADTLGMDIKYEYLPGNGPERIDWAFVPKGAPVTARPLILIETEESHRKPGFVEVEKLAASPAPLKVLLLSWPWSGRAGAKEELLQQWRAIAATHVPQQALLAAIVGEAAVTPGEGDLEAVTYHSHTLKLTQPEEDWVDEGVLIHFRCT